MDTKAIGTLIKDERVRQKMTGEELGAKMGVGKSLVSKIENGSVQTLSSINKAVDALGISLNVSLTPEQPTSGRVVGYVVACINVFAKTFEMTVKEATNYLSRYKGIEFLTKHYEAEHLLSLDDAVQDLAQVCCNNGGGVR